MILCTVLHYELQTASMYHLCVKVGVSYVFSCDPKKQNKLKKKILDHSGTSKKGAIVMIPR